MHEIDTVELPVPAVGPSADFFAAAFGWERTDYGPTYTDMHGGQVTVGLSAEADRVAAPLAIIRSQDLEASLAAVVDAGGIVTVPTFAFPGGRRFQFREPGGCELAVWQRAD